MRRIVFTVITIAGILLLAGCPNDLTPTTYTVTVSPSGAESGESVSAAVSEAAEGATVTLTAALKSGRKVTLSASGVTISPEAISTDGGTATFTMPGQAVEVTATFSDTTYAVTVSSSGAASGESVSSNVSEAAEGSIVTLTAVMNSRRRVELSAAEVTIDPSTISTNGVTVTFTMPGQAVEVTATFSDIPTYAVTVSPSGAESGESVSADVSEAAEGETVTLTAALNSGRQVALSASGVAITPEAISTDSETATFTMPGQAVEVTATYSFTIGATETVTAGSETLTMIYTQDQASISFPTGTNDGTPATLTTQFWMAETEVTNAVVTAVLQWAYDNGKFSSSVDDHNGLDTTTAKHGGQELLDLNDTNCRVVYDGSGNFSAESGYENNPVTNITWYGAVMFCNWLTEMRDGDDGNVVYEWVDNGDGDDGIDSDGIWQDDETDENTALNGYRLPSTDEWEYAARYLGTTAPSTGGDLDTERKYGNDDPDWTDGYYWTPGSYASGATADYNDAAACQAVAVYSGQDPAPTDEAEVKSLGEGSANALGLYDISGNVWEWVFTENGSLWIFRGGCWFNSFANPLRVGYWSSSTPDHESDNVGFRLCRTAD
jgi:formylglycine-generating enzyme